MAKVAVTRLFVGGIAAIVAGVVLQCTAAIAALAGGVVSFGGPNWVEVDGGAFAWTMVALAAIGVLVSALGGMAGVVSWVGALVNTAKLDDKTWFFLLLALGLLSLGFVAMIAYVIAGPDGAKTDRTRLVVAASS